MQLSNPVVFRETDNPVLIRRGFDLPNGNHTLTLTLHQPDCCTLDPVQIEVEVCDCSASFLLPLSCIDKSKIGWDIGIYKTVYTDDQETEIHKGFLTVRSLE